MIGDGGRAAMHDGILRRTGAATGAPRAQSSPSTGLLVCGPAAPGSGQSQRGDAPSMIVFTADQASPIRKDAQVS